MLAMSVSLVDRQILAALAHTVTASLHISEVRYGWWSTAFAGSYLVGSLPAARFVERVGPRRGIAFSLVAASCVIALHAIAQGFWSVLCLRIALGFAIAPSFPCATQAIHRVLPFRDRARAIGLLYLGNSLGSAAAPPVAAFLEAGFGWRDTFTWVAAAGMAWMPLWMLLAFTGTARTTLDEPALPAPPTPLAVDPSVITAMGEQTVLRVGGWSLRLHPGMVRGMVVVATAAPTTALVLLWGAKYLGREYHLSQSQIGQYLWMPALLSGWGSLLFGEIIARRTPTRSEYRPSRGLVVVATALAALATLVPFAGGAWPSIVLASFSMAGSGGLYTLATSDMLARAPRGTVPMTTAVTTLTQSIVYMVANPLIGHSVERTGSYRLAFVAVGVAVLPGSAYWLLNAGARPRPGG